MFEDSTFESTGRIRTRSRRWMLAALILNGSILLALILIPLINPEGLPRTGVLYLVQAPPPPPEAPKPAPRPEHVAEVRPQFVGGSLTAPRTIPNTILISNAPEAPPSFDISALGATPGGVGNGDSPFRARTPVPVVRPEKKGPMPVSSGVMTGQLIYKVTPMYPSIATAMRIEGTVVLQAVISKDGTIENLHVTSGPAMLQQAAIDAVKQWRYRPYLLNGQPVEVETTINVVFTLGR
jgi:protein TonB